MSKDVKRRAARVRPHVVLAVIAALVALYLIAGFIINRPAPWPTSIYAHPSSWHFGARESLPPPLDTAGSGANTQESQPSQPTPDPPVNGPAAPTVYTTATGHTVKLNAHPIAQAPDGNGWLTHTIERLANHASNDPDRKSEPNHARIESVSITVLPSPDIARQALSTRVIDATITTRVYQSPPKKSYERTRPVTPIVGDLARAVDRAAAAILFQPGDPSVPDQSHRQHPAAASQFQPPMRNHHARLPLFRNLGRAIFASPHENAHLPLPRPDIDEGWNTVSATLWSFPITDTITYAVLTEAPLANPTTEGEASVKVTSWIAYAVADGFDPATPPIHADSLVEEQVTFRSPDHRPQTDQGHDLLRVPWENRYTAAQTGIDPWTLPGERITLDEWFAHPDRAVAVVCTKHNPAPSDAQITITTQLDHTDHDACDLINLVIFSSVSDKNLRRAAAFLRDLAARRLDG